MLDNAEFESFHWLTHVQISHYTMIGVYVIFCGVSIFVQVFYILDVLNETIIFFYACWIEDDHSQLGSKNLVGYLLSYIQRALVNVYYLLTGC